jgi:cholest-4-en-3-one 26-monooxygenase
VGYEEAREVMRSPSFGVAGQMELLMNARPYSELSDQTRALFLNALLFTDPPQHTRLRAAVSRAFTPRQMQRLEPRVRLIVDRLLQGIADDPTPELMTSIAEPLPIQVIAELIGVPREDRHKIFEWSNRMIGSEDPEYAVAADEVFQAQVEMFMYAQQLAEQRRDHPLDDIITALLSSEVDGESLSDMDFNLFFLLLSVAGNETTRNAIAHGMNAFLENPDQWELLVGDPEAHLPTAVEEILRWASPVMYFRRNATRDTVVGGETIEAGDKISLWYISANRDEDVFDDPFRFDILREPNEHIAFGGGGPHHCLGANLARMEIKVLFEELLPRLADVAIDGPIDRLRSNFIAGIKRLPIRVTAA